MLSFSAKTGIIGVNPYVLPPASVLKALFAQAGKSKGPLPVKGRLNGKKFTQTLVKYSGRWRLYLNTPMRKAAGLETGDMATVQIAYDPVPRVTPMPPALEQALARNKKAKTAFGKLAPSRQKEIMRYLGFLKSGEARAKNVTRVIQHLAGKERFAGRDGVK